ncbi:outer membrane usher protein [Hafnia paralvei]|uniref:outer membrane usher protein n=1 Tax=Hafnia paralvei TaxID=546367 RepID=UPI0020004EB2|nr:outer membrane usher protein [Hafnia paralvei]MCK2181572.1 outer membrane usher protein [Hafnia paralvei]
MSTFHINKISLAMALAVAGTSLSSEAVEFNTDMLDTADKANIDFSRFSKANYILPGLYQLALRVNDQSVGEYPFNFYPRENEPDSSEACLSPELVSELGLKPAALNKVTYWHQGECADFSQLQGTTVRGDLSNSSLQLSIPQAWIEYSDPNWVPSSRWDEGIPGLLLDYNLNASATRPNTGGDSQNASISGTVGANAGPWRLRGDYQGSYSRTSGSDQGSQHNMDWSRVYMYRALPQLRSTLSMGENYLSSSIFDSWRYTGLSLSSDDRMLPPALRGYAPEVSGIAKTNAKVVVSQQGRVLYETTVPSGPFRIQDLSSAVTGKLDVKVEEQDGTVQTFQVDTATIPYLTRPGMVRYKLAMGRPSTYEHHLQGPTFATGEFSWGIANSWSLYGGSILAGDYNAASIGIGRDLFLLGAVSADVTQSFASVPGEAKRQGKSWRLSYSKRFDEYDSEVTFAGYRFSERDYMSMGEYLDARYHEQNSGHDKELYTVTANKNFSDVGLSFYFTYSHQTYWDQPTDDRYSLSGSTFMNLWELKNVSLNISATRSKINQRDDDAVFVSLSIPMGSSASVSYDGQYNNSRYSQNVSYYDRIDNNNNYRVSTGLSSGGDESTRGQFNGYYSHRGDFANMSANAAYSQGNYSSAGMTMQGGATITAKGAALHSGGISGGTRLMVDTEGVGGVPINGGRVHTNGYGIGVITDMNSYYRNSTSIDLTKMADDVDSSRSVVDSALTEGAIGYRKFGVVKGAKALAVLALADGSHPPFGASVKNSEGRELAIVGDGGMAWLTGLQGGESLDVLWDGAKQCTVVIPKTLSQQEQLLLPCHPESQTQIPAAVKNVPAANPIDNIHEEQ